MSCYPCLKDHIQHTASRINPEELSPRTCSIYTHKPTAPVILVLVEKKPPDSCPNRSLNSSMNVEITEKEDNPGLVDPAEPSSQPTSQSRNNSHLPVVFLVHIFWQLYFINQNYKVLINGSIYTFGNKNFVSSRLHFGLLSSINCAIHMSIDQGKSLAFNVFGIRQTQ